MYNDKNRQIPQSAPKLPATSRGYGDLPGLDGNQGGRGCDGSLGRTSCDRTNNGRGCDGSLGRNSCDRTNNDRDCDGSLGRNSCDRTNNGRGCDGSLGRNSCDQASRDRTVRERACNAKGGNGWGLHEHPLAMVYSPYQHFRDTYTPDVALGRGTLFAELDLPFEGSNNRRNGGCAR